MENDGSAAVDAKIQSLDDWRGAMLGKLRRLIKEADPEVLEDVKWRKAANPLGVPTWSHAGIICTGETYKDKVKLTFAKGAALKDAHGLFNSSLEGGVRRAIDFDQDAKIDEKAIKGLVTEAIAANLASKSDRR